MQRCPICGGKLVRTRSGALVCTVCGLVLDEFYPVPPRNALDQAAPIEGPEDEPSKDDVAVLLRVPRVPEALEELDAEMKEIIGGGEYRAIPASEVSRLLAVARHRWGVEPEERVRRVRELIEKYSRSCGLDPEKVFNLAMKYKGLWGGRKSDTIALAFTYVAARLEEKKCRLPLRPKTRRLARLFYEVISAMEPGNTGSS